MSALYPILRVGVPTMNFGYVIRVRPWDSRKLAEGQCYFTLLSISRPETPIFEIGEREGATLFEDFGQATAMAKFVTEQLDLEDEPCYAGFEIEFVRDGNPIHFASRELLKDYLVALELYPNDPEGVMRAMERVARQIKIEEDRVARLKATLLHTH